MKKEQKNIEYISKRTKRGILLLVFLCLLIIYTPRIISVLWPSEKMELTRSEIKIIDELKTNYREEQDKKKKNSFKRREFRRPPQKFNPNEYTKKEWMYVGLSPKQADVMLKIAKRGIWTNDFLEGITIMPREVFLLIKDSTVYEERVYPKKEYPSYKDEKEPIKSNRPFIEMNSASEAEIISLPGIGPFFAKRIIAYRDLLGGFYRKEQLLEVYDLGLERYETFRSYFEVDPASVTKINLNESSYADFKRHPYIDYAVANSVVKMRDQHGPFKSIDQLKDSELISRELFNKLKPYVYL